MVTEETGTSTVTVHSALTPLPSVAAAVMIALPALRALSSPVSLSTLTVSGSSLDQARVLLEASAGLTVARRVAVLPTPMFRLCSSCMPLTAMALQMTQIPLS